MTAPEAQTTDQGFQLTLTDQAAEEVRKFIDGLVSHYVLDHGELVVAHAGLTEAYQGRASGAVRTSSAPECGLPPARASRNESTVVSSRRRPR